MSLPFDQLAAPPPVAPLLSLLVLAGMDALGLVVSRHVFGLARSGDPAWQRHQAPLVGALVLSLSLYPLALAGLAGRSILSAVAVLLCLAGALHLVRNRADATALARGIAGVWRSGDTADRIAALALLAIMAGLLLVALAPPTAADALDYHLGVAVLVVRDGAMPVRPEWFHSRLAGSGEVLNALGLSLGAESLGALLQYAGLWAAVALIGGIALGEATRSRALVLALAAAAAPVMIFLVSSPKPQLLYHAMVLFALALLARNATSGTSGGAAWQQDVIPPRRILLIGLLVLTAAEAKLSFFLSGGVVAVATLVLAARSGQTARALAALGAAAILALVPAAIWAVTSFDASVLDAVISPLPGAWPGEASFAAALRAYRDSAVPFPMSLVVPGSPGTLATVFGLAPLVVLGLRKGLGRPPLLLLSGAALVAVVGALLGQRTTRFFVDPFLWMLLACAVAGRAAYSVRGVRWLLLPQAAVTAALCWVGALTLFPGSVSAERREAVMTRSADGYALMQWADSLVPRDAVILSSARPMALLPRDGYSLDWSRNTPPDSASWAPYLAYLAEQGVTHLLHLGPRDDIRAFEPCIVHVIAGPAEVATAVRNPFSRGAFEQAWLFRVNGARLPTCARP